MRLEPAAASAPPPSISRNRSPVSASAPARPSAAISQISADGHDASLAPSRPDERLTTTLRNHVVSECVVVGMGERLACRCRRARRCVGCAITVGTKAFRHRIRLGGGRPHRPALAGSDHAGAVSLLQTLRTAAGPAGCGAPRSASRCRYPATFAGCLRARQFQRDAVTAGEALIIARDPPSAIGLVPDFEYPDIDGGVRVRTAAVRALSWTVYSVPGAPGAPATEYTVHDSAQARARGRRLVNLLVDLAVLEIRGPGPMVSPVDLGLVTMIVSPAVQERRAGTGCPRAGRGHRQAPAAQR